MGDLKKVADDVTTKAALAAGKDAARRAVDDLLLSDEEKAQKEAERAAASKSRRTKILVYGVVGLLIVLGVVGLVVSYWHWFLLAGLVGLLALYGRHRLRKRLAARKESKTSLEAKRDDEPTRKLPERAVRLEGDPPADTDATRERAHAIEEQAIEDELAELKARLKQ